MVLYVYADLCSLLAATSQFSILIGQKMQLTGCRNDNEMRNAICVDTKISIEWPYCSFLYCDKGLVPLVAGVILNDTTIGDEDGGKFAATTKTV